MVSNIPKLDMFDLAILDMLQKNNTTPHRIIADEVHLSAPAVQRRIRRLHEQGVIKANVALIDSTKLGIPLTVFLEVFLHSEHPEQTALLTRRIMAEPAIQQCHMVTGEADYLMVVLAESMEALDQLIKRLTEGDDNIRRYQTSLSMKCLKQGLEIPLPRPKTA